MEKGPIRRAELIGYALQATEAKRAALKLVNQRLAKDLVDNVLKPRVIRAAKEGAYTLEFPVMYNTKEILPDVMEAMRTTFPDITYSLKQDEGCPYMIYLDWTE